MLNLLTNTVNNLADRIKQNLTGGHGYLFEFKSKTSLEVFNVVVTEFNAELTLVKFNIDTTLNKLPPGDYDYTVYTYDIDTEQKIHKVKSDIARVRSSTPSGDIYYTDNDNDINIFYENE